MKAIWKYKLDSAPDQKIKIPKGSELLTVQIQNDKLCLWAKVESTEEVENLIICIRATGNHIGEVGEYIGTYQLNNGALVFHVFTGAN